MDCAPLQSSTQSSSMAMRWVRRLERCACGCLTYFPLAFVYSLTTWATWVVCSIGSHTKHTPWIGTQTSAVALVLYGMLNWCYTTAVFTDPGATTNSTGYATLPTTAAPHATSFTVKSNGESRFCKKCQARKPDRAHHCSTCRRCVLKMDHHCPWLATCIGLHNHKAFLLFLIYTTLFCLFTFTVSGTWVYTELNEQTQYEATLLPVNYILAAVVSGIIGIAVGAFTVWHILLASRGQTTIECLEKTRYLSPLRKTLHNQFEAQHNGLRGGEEPGYGQQIIDMHTNALPGVTRPEEGETFRRSIERRIPPRQMSYQEMERDRARKRYEEYMDEQDSEKLPNAFDLGVKRNLLHLFGPKPLLWFIPIINTTGDGWSWEASPKWLAAREQLSKERAAQRERETAAGWGEPVVPMIPERPSGAGRHYIGPPEPSMSTMGRRTPSKADRVLGRDPNLYADSPGPSMQMRTLNSKGRTMHADDDELLRDDDDEDNYDTSSDEESARAATARKAEHQAMNLVTNGGWAKNGASGLLRKSSSRTSTPSQSKSPVPRVDEEEDLD